MARLVIAQHARALSVPGGKAVFKVSEQTNTKLKVVSSLHNELSIIIISEKQATFKCWNNRTC